MGNFAKRIADLSPEKRELLLKHLEKQSLQNGEVPPDIRAYERNQDHFPLSYEQERIWFLNQLNENLGSAYHVAQAYRLTGVLSVPSLERSLCDLVARHEILRVSFGVEAGFPYQQIREPYVPVLPVLDLTSHPAATRNDYLLKQLTEDAKLPFDLQTGKLLRAVLYKLDVNEYVLGVYLHHIVFDGWSERVFWKELTTLYDAYVTGKSAELTEMPIQYIDYVQWQHKYLTGEVMDEHRDYWRTQLDKIPPVLALQTDRSRPSVQTFRGKTLSFSFSVDLFMQIKAFSRNAKATLFMTLLAAFKMLLYRYTGQEEIVVGTPEANRSRIELEGLIGFFVNTLVLRTHISGKDTFRTLLERVKETVITAYDHREMPFGQLVQMLQLQRNQNYNPLYQVMFSMQMDPTSTVQLDGITVELLYVEKDAAQVDLSLMFQETSKQLNAFLLYNTDLFEAETIQSLMRHLIQLLESALKNPDQPIGLLPLLTMQERQRIVYDWNDTYHAFPDKLSIQDQFESQATHAPDAIALIFGEQMFTYQALDQYANQLAHYLQKRGIGPDTSVAVCLNPSPDMVITILGILKAGGAFMPLDPDYPPARLAELLKEARVSTIITQRAVKERLLACFADNSVASGDMRCKQDGGQSDEGRKTPVVICAELDRQDIERESTQSPSHRTHPANLAYMLFTSGSTGQPKGVMISHSSLSNYLAWANRCLLENVDTIPLITKLTFDACLKQLLSPLLCGRTVWILPKEAIQHGSKIIELLATRMHCGLNCVPSLWQSLLDIIETAQIKLSDQSLTDIFVGGDRLDMALIEQTWRYLPWVRLWNLYGPTEATANASFTCLSVDRPVSIGRPIHNTCLYILDTNLQPVPIGISGNLYISGAGIARGYFNQPGLTATKFLPDPFSTIAGARFYDTGDVVRYGSNGDVEFLGRNDRQIKLRGFRIEPREIETKLALYPPVKDTLVIMHESSQGEKMLVAYIILREGLSTTSNELRTYLQAELPSHMIPSAFLFLEKFPLTAHGKLDIMNLPNPVKRGNEKTSFIPPTTELEKLLVKMWCELLSNEKIGIYDDFFISGGYSLTVIRFLSWIKAIFRLDLPLVSFFKKPTIAHIAQFILDNEEKSGLSEKIASKVNQIDGLSINDILRELPRQGTTSSRS